MANRSKHGDGGRSGHSRCTAVFFLLLLAGKEVGAVRDNAILHELDNLKSDLAVGLAARGTGWKFATNGTDRTLFTTAAERKARVDEWRSRLKAHMQTEGQPSLCKSTNWVEEREKFQMQVRKIQDHSKTVYQFISASGGSVKGKWGFAEAKLLSAEAKALNPCLKAEKSGKISDKELDRELKQYFEEGPDMISSSGADSFLVRTYAAAWAAAWAAIMATDGLNEYRQSSGCKLGWQIGNRPLDRAFRAKPVCFNDCDSPRLNVDNFAERVRNSLSSCSPPKELPTFAYGSTDWFRCGGSFSGTTRSCMPAHGYSACCCKAGSLNGPYTDVEDNNGCTQTCDTKTAKFQRSLQQRIALVMEEYNTDSCNYGERVRGIKLASLIRNHMEKDYYKQAMGHTLTVEDIDKEEQDAVEIGAESLVQLEEGQGSFLEMDPASSAILIMCAVLLLVWLVVFFILPAIMGIESCISCTPTAAPGSNQTYTF